MLVRLKADNINRYMPVGTSKLAHMAIGVRSSVMHRHTLGTIISSGMAINAVLLLNMNLVMSLKSFIDVEHKTCLMFAKADIKTDVDPGLEFPSVSDAVIGKRVPRFYI